MRRGSDRFRGASAGDDDALAVDDGGCVWVGIPSKNHDKVEISTSIVAGKDLGMA